MAAKNAGFTLLELVITLVLLGVLSAAVFSRLLPSDSFDAARARDLIISLSRAAQQKSLGRQDVVLTLWPAGGELQIRLSDSTGVLETVSTPLRDVELAGDVNLLHSCALIPAQHAISASTPLQMMFAWPGDLQAGGVLGAPGFPQSVSHGMRICINGEPATSVCLSAAGLAYAGDCDA